jgi:hypothetical protein
MIHEIEQSVAKDQVLFLNYDSNDCDTEKKKKRDRVQEKKRILKKFWRNFEIVNVSMKVKNKKTILFFCYLITRIKILKRTSKIMSSS